MTLAFIFHIERLSLDILPNFHNPHFKASTTIKENEIIKRKLKESIYLNLTPKPISIPNPRDVSVNKRKRDPSSCPICGLTISQSDLQTHFMHELERLYKLSGTGIVAGRKRRADSRRSPVLPGDSGPEGRWETFQRIKVNRHGRLRTKIKKRKGEDCPVCSERIHRSPETVSVHEDQCSRKNMNEEDETVDVEGDSEFDEWAEGQRRRTNPLTIVGTTPSSSGRVSTDAEGDDVIVDGDELEESAFGPSQYTESDVVIKNIRDKHHEKEGQVDTVNSSGDVEVKSESAGQQCDSIVSTSDAEPSSRAQMIEELRNRIRQLEAEGPGDTFTTTDNEDYKCLICLEHYKKPVISTVCWHVHCEECWLHTLGSKKVCPQCSMITSPTDLRRIFM
ncbi:E3 ubiquitin-protein ligase RNF220 [Popillia japonica]|uniref:E3 ubiquitin-protein ligase RNF220 n=1 Tax=Popillia japonica TaxID=7064 RepID=A0AAW1IW92_POPJA